MARPVYLDYNATTPVDPAVLDAMLPYFTEQFGNPSSAHAYGWIADEAVKQAREQLAALLGARPDALTFTSGATEAANLAIRGTAAAYRGKKDHVITVATEHKAVLDPVKSLEAEGYRVTVLDVQPDGRLDLDALRDALTDTTLLVAVMWANNETGVLQPIPEIAGIARAARRPFYDRCHAGRRQNPRRRGARRSARLLGAQGLRAEGCRRAVPEPAAAARPARP